MITLHKKWKKRKRHAAEFCHFPLRALWAVIGNDQCVPMQHCLGTISTSNGPRRPPPRSLPSPPAQRSNSAICRISEYWRRNLNTRSSIRIDLPRPFTEVRHRPFGVCCLGMRPGPAGPPRPSDAAYAIAARGHPTQVDRRSRRQQTDTCTSVLFKTKTPEFTMPVTKSTGPAQYR